MKPQTRLKISDSLIAIGVFGLLAAGTAFWWGTSWLVVVPAVVASLLVGFVGSVFAPRFSWLLARAGFPTHPPQAHGTPHNPASESSCLPGDAPNYVSKPTAESSSHSFNAVVRGGLTRRYAAHTHLAS